MASTAWITTRWRTGPAARSRPRGPRRSLAHRRRGGHGHPRRQLHRAVRGRRGGIAEGAELVDAMADAELAPASTGRSTPSPPPSSTWTGPARRGALGPCRRPARKPRDRRTRCRSCSGREWSEPRRGDWWRPQRSSTQPSRSHGWPIHSEGLVWNLFARSRAATAAGDVEPALALAEEAVEAARPGGGAFPAMGAGVALADALVGVASTPGRRRSCWRPAVEMRCRSSRRAGGPRRSRCSRAACSAGTTATTRPRRPSGRCHWPARSAPAPPPRAPSARSARSRCTPKIRKRRRPRAGTAEAADRAGTPIEAALAPAGRAGARAGGEKERAVTELEHRPPSFEACGALGRRDEAERELGKLGRRPHRRSRKGDAGATGLSRSPSASSRSPSSSSTARPTPRSPRSSS